MFAKTQWYVASWAKDLDKKPLARTICNEPIVFYRKTDNSIAALEDSCPHRRLPLSMGLIEGDHIRCLYHGLLLSDAGKCVEMPGNQAANPSVCVKAYPVIERYNLIWVWIGDADQADPSLLPDLWMCEHEQWRSGGRTYEVACDYRLLIDNLMDLTHETLVHANTIGQPELHDFPVETSIVNNKVITSRWMSEVFPPPFFKARLGDYEGVVHRWQICNYLPPTGVLIDVGVAKPERGATLENHENADQRFFIINFSTPETETTTHYFWGNASCDNVDDEEAFNRVLDIQGGVFMEDVVVLEAQQRAINLSSDQKLRIFGIDSGGASARRILEKLVQA